MMLVDTMTNILHTIISMDTAEVKVDTEADRLAVQAEKEECMASHTKDMECHLRLPTTSTLLPQPMQELLDNSLEGQVGIPLQTAVLVVMDALDPLSRLITSNIQVPPTKAVGLTPLATRNLPIKVKTKVWAPALVSRVVKIRFEATGTHPKYQVGLAQR